MYDRMIFSSCDQCSLLLATLSHQTSPHTRRESLKSTAGADVPNENCAVDKFNYHGGYD